MYGLTDDDLDAPGDAPAAFADELIPLRGRGRAGRRRARPTDVASSQHAAGDRARAVRHQHARVELGGRGCTTLQQVLVQEQGGRVTNALGLGAWHTPPAWWPDGRQRPTSASAGCCPTVRGETHECYAITEEYAGSDVADLAATARRDGDDYVLDGEKWHVTSYNEADLRVLPGRADRRRRTPASTRCSSSTCRRPGVRVVRTPAYTHTHRPPPPDRRVRGRAGAGRRTWSAPRATA